MYIDNLRKGKRKMYGYVKVPYEQLWHVMNDYNTKHPEKSETGNLFGVIVYKASNWPDKEYSLASRSYEVSNANRCFQNGKIANSLFGYALDGSDSGVRLDWYNWEVDYCYMIGFTPIKIPQAE